MHLCLVYVLVWEMCLFMQDSKKDCSEKEKSGQQETTHVLKELNSRIAKPFLCFLFVLLCVSILPKPVYWVFENGISMRCGAPRAAAAASEITEALRLPWHLAASEGGFRFVTDPYSTYPGIKASGMGLPGRPFIHCLSAGGLLGTSPRS